MPPTEVPGEIISPRPIKFSSFSRTHRRPTGEFQRDLNSWPIINPPDISISFAFHRHISGNALLKHICTRAGALEQQPPDNGIVLSHGLLGSSSVCIGTTRSDITSRGLSRHGRPIINVEHDS